MSLPPRGALPGTSASWTLDLKTAAIWGALAGAAAIAVLPYLRQLTPQAFEGSSMSFPVLAAVQGLQALVVVGLLALVGLRMGHRVGLGSPLLQGWLQRRRADWTSVKPLQAIALGTAAALAILGGAALLDPMLPEPLQPLPDPGAGASALNGLLGSFYGGIVEELQMRLFVMTLLAWAFTTFGRRRPGAALVWMAIVVAALVFGAGHLPGAAKLWGLTDIVIVRTIALNAIGGIVFGWLFWKRGLEMAMLGHFSADIVLHVLAPLAFHPPA